MVMATARPLFAFELTDFERRPLAPAGDIALRPLILALLAAIALILGASLWRAALEPTAAQLGALSPSAGGSRGQIGISAVIPERLALVAPAAVRVQRSGEQAATPRFDLCLGGSTAQGYRLGFADAAPGQALLHHGAGGAATVVAQGAEPGAVQTGACARPGAQADYSLRFSQAPAVFDRPVTVLVIPQ
jgi:hypothetical protein